MSWGGKRRRGRRNKCCFVIRTEGSVGFFVLFFFLLTAMIQLLIRCSVCAQCWDLEWFLIQLTKPNDDTALDGWLHSFLSCNRFNKGSTFSFWAFLSWKKSIQHTYFTMTLDRLVSASANWQSVWYSTCIHMMQPFCIQIWAENVNRKQVVAPLSMILIKMVKTSGWLLACRHPRVPCHPLTVTSSAEEEWEPTLSPPSSSPPRFHPLSQPSRH